MDYRILNNRGEVRRPKLGEIVMYYPCAADIALFGMACFVGGTLVGIVVDVSNSRAVNLVVLDWHGKQFRRLNVLFAQAGDIRYLKKAFCQQTQKEKYARSAAEMIENFTKKRRKNGA